MMMRLLICIAASGGQCFYSSQDASIFCLDHMTTSSNVAEFIKHDTENRKKKICALRVVLLTAQGWMSNNSPCPHNTPCDWFSFVHCTNEFTWLIHANMQIPKPVSFLRICSREKGHRPSLGGWVLDPAPSLSRPLSISLD